MLEMEDPYDLLDDLESPARQRDTASKNTIYYAAQCGELEAELETLRIRAKGLKDALEVMTSQASLFNSEDDDMWCAVRKMAEDAIALPDGRNG